MNYTVIAVSLLSLSLIILSTWIIILERRISVFLKGGKALPLEELIAKNQEEIEGFFIFEEEMRKELSQINARVERKIDTVVLERFNPFQGNGMGGNHSFAAAFLDEKGNGAVVSTLYTREKVSTYAKPVVNYSSEIELTDEERSVIKKTST